MLTDERGPPLGGNAGNHRIPVSSGTSNHLDIEPGVLSETRELSFDDPADSRDNAGGTRRRGNRGNIVSNTNHT